MPRFPTGGAHGIDYAYGCENETEACALIWSPVLPNYASSFCAKCYPAIVTAGSGGPETGERDLILDQMSNVVSREWMGDEFNRTMPCRERGSRAPNVAFCDNEEKLEAVYGIQAWYKSQGIEIASKDVHFFDDKEANVAPFEGSGFNAREISCGSRDSTRGLCGAAASEIVDTQGVSVCSDHSVVLI